MMEEAVEGLRKVVRVLEARMKLRETKFLNKRKQDMDDVSMEDMHV